MTEFRDQELDGGRFERVKLTKAIIQGLEVKGGYVEKARLRGVELVDVEIHGEVNNVVVNGVDIGPLIDAELNRRTPERAKMNAQDPAGFREAWAILERRWAETVERARTFGEADLHRSVDDEWSFVETVRHLNFASAAWVGRMVLGNPSPWHPLDLPWDEAPDWEGIPRDRAVRPSLDEVLVVRRERQAMVGEVIAGLTDDQLATTVSRPEPGWPQEKDVPIKLCLQIVLNEEWEHRRYAERDLTLMEEN